MREQAIMQRVMVASSRLGWRLFRNNVGVLPDARGVPIRYGLCPGSADLVGWRSITITPDMVGTTIAQFAAIEVKTDGGKLTAEQQRWLLAVNDAGGYARVVRTAERLGEEPPRCHPRCPGYIQTEHGTAPCPACYGLVNGKVVEPDRCAPVERKTSKKNHWPGKCVACGKEETKTLPWKYCSTACQSGSRKRVKKKVKRTKVTDEAPALRGCDTCAHAITSKAAESGYECSQLAVIRCRPWSATAAHWAKKP